MDIKRFNDYAELTALRDEAGRELYEKDREYKSIMSVADQLEKSARQIDEGVEPLPEDLMEVRESERQAGRAALSSGLFMAALTVRQVEQQFQSMAAAASGLLQRVFHWFLNHLFKVLNFVAGLLNVDSWSIEASGGFPSGVNVAISVTFK